MVNTTKNDDNEITLETMVSNFLGHKRDNSSITVGKTGPIKPPTIAKNSGSMM